MTRYWLLKESKEFIEFLEKLSYYINNVVAVKGTEQLHSAKEWDMLWKEHEHGGFNTYTVYTTCTRGFW